MTFFLAGKALLITIAQNKIDENAMVENFKLLI
jgi:hypothetical protein